MTKLTNHRFGKRTETDDERKSIVSPPPTKKRKKNHEFFNMCVCKMKFDLLQDSSSAHKLRDNKECSDIVIIAADSDKSFSVNRIVLLSLGKFTQQLRLSKIGLHCKIKVDIPCRILNDLIDFAYTGCAKINDENLPELIMIAKKYEIWSLLQICNNHLLQTINFENAIKRFLLTSECLCKHVTNKVRIYILQNFITIFDVNGLKTLPPEIIESFIKDDALNLTEEHLFEILQHWKKHNTMNYDDDNEVDLFKHVRWTLMDIGYFISNVESSDSSFTFKKYFLDAKAYFRQIERARSASRRFIRSSFRNHQPRKPKELVLSFGGWKFEEIVINEGLDSQEVELINGPTDCIEIFDIRSNQWMQSSYTLPCPRTYASSARIKDNIFIVGGYDGSSYLNSMICFNINSKEWREKAPMNTPRCYVSIVQFEENIYAIGGHNGRNRLSSFECYNSKTNMWKTLKSLNDVRSDGAAVAHTNGKIYALGGQTGSSVLQSVEVYEPLSNEWSYALPMTFGRSGMKAIVYEHKIYVIGGYDGQQRLDIVECFDPNMPNLGWTQMASLLQPRSNFSVIVNDGSIMVCGGYNDEYGVLNDTEIYDSVSNKWRTYAGMNVYKSGLCLESINNSVDI